MSQNPYANPYPQQYAQPYPPGYGAAPPARTSVMAVLSLIFSLLCCTAPLGVLFGGLALLAIAFSGGKVKGMGLAIAGLIIGIIFSVIIIGSTFAAIAGLNMLGQPASTAITSIEQGDEATVQGLFTQGAQASITDQRVDEFRDIIAADLGVFEKMPDGVGDWYSGYVSVFTQQANGQAMQTSQSRYPDDVIPFPVKFDQGWELVLIVIDQSGTPNSSGAPLYRDIGIIRDDGSIEWLVAGNEGGGATIPRMSPSGPDADPDVDPEVDPDAEPEAGNEDPGAEPTGRPAPSGRNRKP